MSIQTDEGPVKEGGQPEAQGAAGKEQECPDDGRGQEERGQSERKLAADKGMQGEDEEAGRRRKRAVESWRGEMRG